ncbi:oligo-1,6-glucosidase [Crenobacter luteus]|uniref:glycoside hydrolase family 13 protein n=1 Tax=Crenobacter luteus TaxID=1452487 RepID=UPI0010462261|nr:alpha-glucosidase [Crenobacter luteus]TCP08469.1 oligo-1,6-glucosidase [Crenobacter luteus]
MQRKWWQGAVVYQIYPRSFCDANGDGVGDLAGIIGKLDYLETLGVDAIWLSPVYRSPMDDNGYDISDYQDIAAEFGTLAQMETLIAEAGRRGIRIVMDLVVNHTSDEHPWFVDAKASKDSPYRDFYIWRQPGPDGGPPDDQRSYFGGSAWEYDAASGEYYFHLFSRRQPDLDWENPAVHEAVHRMMNWWLDKGIGGFRMDVIDLIGKEVDKQITADGPCLHGLLRQMHEATLAGRDVVTVGETWSATPEGARLYSDPARRELSMVFSFEHVTQTWDAEHGKWRSRPFELVAFKRVVSRWQAALAEAGWNSLFWSNHDLPRAVSKYGDEGRFRVESAKALATVLHGLRGTPYVYQGEEIGLVNPRFDSIDDYRDIETLNLYRERIAAGETHEAMMAGIRANGRDNARTPMPWDASEHGGFGKAAPWIRPNPDYAEVNVAAALADPDSVFHHYRRLIRLRKDEEALVLGDYRPLLDEHPEVFAYLRTLGGRRLAVVGNLSPRDVELALPAELESARVRCLIAHYDAPQSLSGRLALRPYEAFIVELAPPP